MWEIYAYQNSESLFGIFNAAAAIHASSDYLAAVAAVAFCGFVAALIAYAFAPEKPTSSTSSTTARCTT
ncbi:MAG: conjugal transfer protein TraG N-terminal domain-containing protein [Betaproteobacteria bacterium]|nr:conjugal transfer protein TraG N-terminal domain-containing protein [Betaproteobacteria bacterium]